MQTIMIVVLEESEDVRDDLLLVILSALGRNKSVSSSCFLSAYCLQIMWLTLCSESSYNLFLICILRMLLQLLEDLL